LFWKKALAIDKS